MTRFLVPLGLFVALAVVLAIGIDRSPTKGVIASPLIGRPAPHFVLPTLPAGEPFDSRELAGQWFVLNVWGTWCVECRREHSVLLQARAAGHVPIIGLNWRDQDDLALQWLAELGNPYERVPVDREGRVAIDWGVYGAPETFLVNDRGVVVHKHVGPLTGEIWQRDFLSRLPQPRGAGS
jgi:cytochrome c biogenesis protein CcmG/thiol:disulfide interchange protein DsbE